MGCVSTKEEADDDNHLVVDGGHHECNSNCHSNGSVCRSCSEVVLICAIQKCSDCGEVHCSNCLRCDSDRQNDDLICPKCLFLSSGQFTPQDLLRYSIRELRQFLCRKDIDADNCREKSDLIDLVMLLSHSSEYLESLSEHTRHVQMLRDRMLMDQSNEHPNTLLQLQNDPNPTGFNELSDNIMHSIDSAYSSTDDKLSSSERLELDADDENHEGAASEDAVISEFSAHDCPESAIEEHSKQVKNISGEENISDENELTTMDENETPQVTNSTDISSSSTKGKIADPLCRICSKTKTDCVFLECGHMVACFSCGEQIVECPVCFSYITRRVRAFRA